MTLDLGKLRDIVEARNPHPRTHSDDCYLWDDHRDCAILRLVWVAEALIDEVSMLHKRVDELTERNWREGP